MSGNISIGEAIEIANTMSNKEEVQQMAKSVSKAVENGNIQEGSVASRILPYIIAGALYTISPIDLIPDIVPVLGQSDDIVVILIALYAMSMALKKSNKTE